MEDLLSQLMASLKGIWKYRWVALGLMWLVAIAGWAKVLASTYHWSVRNGSIGTLERSPCGTECR